MKKTVGELVAVLHDVTICGDQNRWIRRITHDSREQAEDMLFVCIPGATVDGHDFIEQAVANGAVAVLVEKDVAVPEGIVALRVNDVRIAVQAIVPYFYAYPGRALRMIGVTGTNGKTTTTYLIRAILRRAGYKVGLIGTIRIMIEDEVLPVRNTTPDVVDLQRVLAKMVAADVDYVIMEVSSHALVQNRIAGCEFDTAVFTNLTRDHLDYHKTFENYTAAKALLFDNLSAVNVVKSRKTAVLNMDDAAGGVMRAHAKCDVLTYGVQRDADLRAEEIHVLAKGTNFKIARAAGDLALDLKITGLFNVYNVLGAVGCALAEGVSSRMIKEALEDFTSVQGRFELVDEGQSFGVIVDYAHTPDGLENILKTARQITAKRILTVFGCGGDRDRTKRPIMGRIAAQLSDVVIATSDNPRSEEPDFILSQVEEGVLAALGGKLYEKIADRRAAIRRALALAEEGDIVIIAGKGHETYQILKNETIHFDDKEIAREALRELK